MFAVFSVVISISGSVKYSDATHLPFSDPIRKHKGERGKVEGHNLDLFRDAWKKQKHVGLSISPHR